MIRYFLLGLILASAVLAAPPQPVITPAKGEQCVEPVDVMRRQHMDLLTHLRDKTVHQGIRGQRHSLIDCVGCHTQKDQSSNQYIPINDTGQFCQSCHAYSAVRIDCFECHAAVPAND